MLQASCIPLSQLELLVGDLVPRLSTRLFVMGEGPEDPLALDQRAVRRLAELGYSDVTLVEGGLAAWRAAGYELFSGVGAYSKAFGEWVAVKYETPYVTPEQQHELVDQGVRHVILDCRPRPEYRRMTLPGSRNAPGADLVYRAQEAVEDDTTLILVHCAGRTRSIIGTQSLVNAGLPNPVAAIENGTMGWQLAGYDLEFGQTREAPVPAGPGLDKARQCAERLTKRFGVRQVDLATVRQWQAEANQHTLYLIDVRLPEEYEAGHWAEARNVQGGQLVQATDEYISVFNSRIVLVDDTEVRAVITASWLIQLGWREVYVLAGGGNSLPQEKGPYRGRRLGLATHSEVITPQVLAEALKNQAPSLSVVDLASSAFHQLSHIPGAGWAIRSRLSQDLASLPAGDTLVLTSEDGALAHLAARDLAGQGGAARRVLVLEGGTKAWLAAGLPSETGMQRPLSAVEDAWYMPYMHPDAPEQAKRDYFAWELGLVEQVERDGTAKYRFFPPEVR